MVTVHEHLRIIKSQSMLFLIFFGGESFFKEMTDLTKSDSFYRILYREDKLIILGINFNQYLIFSSVQASYALSIRVPTISIR